MLCKSLYVSVYFGSCTLGFWPSFSKLMSSPILYSQHRYEDKIHLWLSWGVQSCILQPKTPVMQTFLVQLQRSTEIHNFTRFSAVKPPEIRKYSDSLPSAKTKL